MIYVLKCESWSGYGIIYAKKGNVKWFARIIGSHTWIGSCVQNAVSRKRFENKIQISKIDK